MILTMIGSLVPVHKRKTHPIFTDQVKMLSTRRTPGQDKAFIPAVEAVITEAVITEVVASICQDTNPQNKVQIPNRI